MAVFFYAVVLFASIGSKPVDGAFRFTQQPSDPSYFEKGTNATLVWDYSVDNQQTELEGISWSVLVGSSFVSMLVKIGDADPVPHRDIPSTYKGRVFIKGRATLVIGNITLQDSTSFQCTLSAKQGSGLFDVNSDVTLSVTENATASVLQQVLVADVSDSATFNCNATGSPAPTITWMRQLQNDERVVVRSSSKYRITSGSGPSSQLTIKNITSGDHGYYECKANGSGFDVEDIFLGVPHLNARKGSTQFSFTKGVMGRLVTLDCPVNGFPQPEVTWTLPNGSVLPNRLVSTLPIILKTNADFGNYTCSAKSLDRTIPHFIISVQDAVSPLKSKVTDGEPAVVEWDAVSGAEYYLVKITGDNVHDDAELGSGSDDSITIHFHTLVLKANKEVKEVQITVQVLAMDDNYELLAKGERLDATVSASVALQATVLHLCVVLVQMLNGQ